MVLLSKAAIQKSGDSVYVRVYIPSEVVQKLGISEQNPYIMWTSIGEASLISSISKEDAVEIYNKYQEKSKELREIEDIEKEVRKTRERTINSDYCEKWTEELREAVRERDNYECQKCHRIEEEVSFDVHHINEDKENPYAELITLCPYCHKLVRSVNKEENRKILLSILEKRNIIGWTRKYLEGKL